jgi:hypothetical protein
MLPEVRESDFRKGSQVSLRSSYHIQLFTYKVGLHTFLVLSRHLGSYIHYNLYLKKGQPGARSSCLHRVGGRVQQLFVLYMQPFSAFLQEAVSRT